MNRKGEYSIDVDYFRNRTYQQEDLDETVTTLARYAEENHQD